MACTYAAVQQQKTSLPQHIVSVSPLCLFAFACSQSVVRHTHLVGRCRRSTDGKWRQQRLGSRLCMTLGWSIFGVGNLLRFAAMRFAAQMVLSGLGSLQFVMIPVVSNFLLGDKYTWEAFVSIVIILGGAQHALCHCCLASLCSACCKAVKTCCLPFQYCSCLTSATHTHSFSVLILVILTMPYAVPKDLLQRSQVTTHQSMVWDLATTPAFLTPFCRFDTGNTLIVIYGPAEVKFTLEQLRLQWTTTSMIVFIVVLGILLGGLHWGKRYVAGLRAEAQAASVRVRWRSKAKKEPQLLVFSHALLFSAYAGLIGELPFMPCVKPGSREPVKLCSSCQSSQCKSAASYRCNPSKWPSASNKQICTTSSPVQSPDHHDTLDPYQLLHCDGSMDSIAALLNKTNHLDYMCHVSRCMECAVLQVHYLHHHSGMAKPGGRLVQLVLCAGVCGQRRLLDQGHQSGLAPLLFFPHHPPHAGLLDCPVHH